MEYLQVSVEKFQSDGDGVYDFIEIYDLETDPKVLDVDENGVTLGEKDYDGDGLTNAEESKLGTRVILSDTDEDGLSDYDEVRTYKTNPLHYDTDGDSVSDGTEVELGTNPLVAEDTFRVKITAKDEDTVKVSAELELSAKQAESLTLEKINNDALFPEDMPGYIGGAYDFNVDGTFESAKIEFIFDEALLDQEDFVPTIYYFNEEEQVLEPLETEVNGNIASTTVTHFSKYICLDTKKHTEAFQWVEYYESNAYNGIEIVFVIDDSGSMKTNDPQNERLSVVKNLIDTLPLNSKIGIVRASSDNNVLTSKLETDREHVRNLLSEDYFVSLGGTYIYTAVVEACSLYEKKEDDILRMMVVLSDGDSADVETKFTPAIFIAQDKDIRIHTVSLGSTYNSYRQYLKTISIYTNGEYYSTQNVDELKHIYEDIGIKIDYETDSDGDGLSDYIEDHMMIFNGTYLSMNKYNVDTDDDGLNDGKEISEVKYQFNEDKTKVIISGKLQSDPTREDSDGDGLYDNAPRKARGEIVAPKDTKPLQPNGTAEMWDFHVEQNIKYEAPSQYKSGLGLDDFDDEEAKKIVEWVREHQDEIRDNEKIIKTLLAFLKADLENTDIAKVVVPIILNFVYDEQEMAYHSQPDTWQRAFGYNYFYDYIFDIATEMKFTPFEFISGEQRYAIWAWKGDYWNLGFGAEIGLYVSDNIELELKDIHLDAVDFELPMKLSLYHNQEVNTNYFMWWPEDDQWWITGFKQTGVKQDYENLVMIGSIDFLGRTQLFKDLKAKYDIEKVLGKKLIFDEDKHTLWIIM